MQGQINWKKCFSLTKFHTTDFFFFDASHSCPSNWSENTEYCLHYICWICVHAVPVVYPWGHQINFLKIITLTTHKEDGNLGPVFSKNVYKLFENSMGSLACKYCTYVLVRCKGWCACMDIWAMSHGCLLHHCWLALKAVWCLRRQLLPEQSHTPSLQHN